MTDQAAGSSKSLFLIGSQQLFPPRCLKGHENDLFMIVEDRAFGTPFKCHKHKLAFQLSSMRHYARELRAHDLNVLYFELKETQGYSYETLLAKVLKEGDLKQITCFEFEDHDRENRLYRFCEENNIELTVKTSPAFLVTRQEFEQFLKEERRPLPSVFYETQRRRLNILMEPNGQPVGGVFTFHDEQRLKWPGKTNSPRIPVPLRDEVDKAAIKQVEQEFADHPGEALTMWYPTTREAALETLHDFCKYRLPEYGPYDETLCAEEDFLFHSVLSPLMNAGLLLESEVLEAVMQSAKENSVPLNSLESFVHKVFGCREYMRGIYQNFGDQQMTSNFWKHHRKMKQSWFDGTTGVLPLDEAINKAVRLSYNHHIERLVILANMMNLAELEPSETYKWFVEMHADSAEWITAPNVFGLGLHADGGALGTRPHIFGSYNWLKLSNYEKADWCTEVDGLYWRFVENHREHFASSPGLSSLAENLDKIPTDRRESLNHAAEAFLARNTVYP